MELFSFLETALKVSDEVFQESMSVLWLFIGLVIGNNLDYLREDKEGYILKEIQAKEQSKDNKVYLYLYRLFPVVIMLCVVSYNLGQVLFYKIDTDIHILFRIGYVLLSGFLMYYFTVFIYGDNIRYKYDSKDNSILVKKELIYMRTFCIICFCLSLLMLMKPVWWLYLNNIYVKIPIILLIIIMSAYIVWYIVHILKEYHNLTNRENPFDFFKVFQRKKQKGKPKELIIKLLDTMRNQICRLFCKWCCKRCCEEVNQEVQSQEDQPETNNSIQK